MNPKSQPARRVLSALAVVAVAGLMLWLQRPAPPESPSLPKRESTPPQSSVAVGAASPTAPADFVLAVAYSDPIVTVDARNATLEAILDAIAGKAGFALENGAATRNDRVDAVKDTGPVPDVLARLLARYNYSLVFREGAAPRVAKLMVAGLKGAPTTAGPALPAPGASAAVAPAEAAKRVNSLLTRQATTGRPDLAARVQPPAAASEPAPAAASAGDGPTPSAGNPKTPGGTVDPMAPNPALAELTRQAQRDVQALVQSLDAARQSLPAAPKPGSRNPPANP